ncbi:MAG: hypothetical protein JHD16_08730 [Solirubrobacteraceae bacterium]|nr:hypothetical protein [Solirubrobacteraceae bacterium]
MPRKRLGLRHSWATTLGQKVMVVPALALIYSGAVILALAAGVAPAEVNAVSGYQWVYERLGALDPADWSTATRAVVAAAGVVGLIVLVALGWAQRLIPHVTRTSLTLRDEADGRTTVSPRAIERAVEIAARHAGVRDAKATLDEDDLQIALHARRADLIPEVLRTTKTRAQSAIEQAGLPDSTAVRVTVTRFTPASRTELLK